MARFSIACLPYSVEKVMELIEGKGVDLMYIDTLYRERTPRDQYHVFEPESPDMEYVVYTHFDHQSNVVLLGYKLIKELKDRGELHVPAVYISAADLSKAQVPVLDIIRECGEAQRKVKEAHYQQPTVK